METVQLKVFFL